MAMPRPPFPHRALMRGYPATQIAPFARAQMA